MGELDQGPSSDPDEIYFIYSLFFNLVDAHAIHTTLAPEEIRSVMQGNSAANAPCNGGK